jgi:hypothetical protein
MVSEAKLAANRRNAQRSTGPRTPEGKARSASNSTIHNFRSRQPLELTSEDHQAITVLIARLTPEARPQNPEEAAIVHELATAHQIRTLVERELDHALCTNEPTALKYLERHHSAASTRHNRAYDAYKTLLHSEVEICTNEPTEPNRADRVDNAGKPPLHREIVICTNEPTAEPPYQPNYDDTKQAQATHNPRVGSTAPT